MLLAGTQRLVKRLNIDQSDVEAVLSYLKIPNNNTEKLQVEKQAVNICVKHILNKRIVNNFYNRKITTQQLVDDIQITPEQQKIFSEFKNTSATQKLIRLNNEWLYDDGLNILGEVTINGFDGYGTGNECVTSTDTGIEQDKYFNEYHLASDVITEYYKEQYYVS